MAEMLPAASDDILTNNGKELKDGVLSLQKECRFNNIDDTSKGEKVKRELPHLSVRLLEQDQKEENAMCTRTWSEELLGNIHISKDGDNGKWPEVRVESISIVCPGRSDMILTQPFASSPKACLFHLKEGSRFRLRFSFFVSNHAVVGLKYINSLWKGCIRVDKSEVTLGTFKPKHEIYTYELKEDTAPGGVFVRGLYCARAKVVDHKGKCYLDIKYYFEIHKHWPSS